METRDRILIVDDDPEIRRLLVDYLAKNGFEALPARDGREMAQMLDKHAIDLVVLDLNLPDADGLPLCRDLRTRSNLPVLMLTARGEEADRIVGIEMGADDYLVKPFSLAELLARMRVALRHRGTVTRSAIVRYERTGLTVDLEARRVHRDGAEVRLTPTEYRLLARLVRQAGQVVTHRQLLLDVWGPEYTEHTHYLRLYMAQLRAKLEAEPADPRVLLTEPGVGYRLAEPGD